MTFKVGDLARVKPGNDLFHWTGMTGICVTVYDVAYCKQISVSEICELGLVFGGSTYGYDYNFMFTVDDIQHFVSMYDTELEEVKDE